MARENDIGFAVRRLSNLIKRDVEKMKIKIGIEDVRGVNGWAIDYFYANRNNDIFQKDFEEKFSIRRSTASNILKTMEQKGLIERISVENDARLKKIVLTTKACELHEKINKDIENREKRMKNGLTDSEVETFLCVLKKISANMENEYD